MLCLKKRRTYSFTQGACNDVQRRSTKEKNDFNETLSIAVTTLPRKHRSREERSSGVMVLTVTEDTPADMLAGSMELLVQLPRDHNVHTQRVTVPRSTPMMDLLVQIATAHKLSASSYTLQAIGERGLVLPHQPNTPIGALDALQVKLLPKQGTFLSRKAKQANQPFETTFRLQVLLPRNQLYVSRVSPKMNLGKILDEVCREKNLDKNKYELRHPANLEETLDLSLSLQDYHLQEVTLYAKQGRNLGAALSSQDIMALQRQEERRRQQAKQSVFGFMFRKSKESSLSIDSLGGRSISPARSDETGRSVSPLAPPSRPLRKRRPAPKPPVQTTVSSENDDESKEKLVISHSRNSSDSSGYHEASVLSDNPDSGARMPETLPRRSKPPCKIETPRKLAQTSQASKSLGNLATASGGLTHAVSSSSISSTGVRKKRAAPPPPIARPLSSAISTQALERILDSEESLTSDIDISKSPSDIAASSKANSDIGGSSKANSDIGVHSLGSKPSSEIGYKIDAEFRAALADHEDIGLENERHSEPDTSSVRLKPATALRANVTKPESGTVSSLEISESVETPRIMKRETRALAPTPKPRSIVRACKNEIPVPLGCGELKTDSTTFPSIGVVIKSEDRIDLDNSAKTERTVDDIEPVGLAEIPEINKSSVSADTPEPGSVKSEMHATRNRLKHVKSMDDIYGLSLEFSDDKINNDSHEFSEGLSCAVISTIPKCSHLTENVDEIVALETETKCSKTNSKPAVIPKMMKNHIANSQHNRPTTKKRKIFRSQSASNDFDVNSFEKQVKHLSSHSEDFNCALNPNVSRESINYDTSRVVDRTYEDADVNGLVKTSGVQNKIVDFPPFVRDTINLGCQKDSKVVVAENNDKEEPQLVEPSASEDRTSDTELLLQKVSDTLSNSIPISEPPATREIKIVTLAVETITNGHLAENDESDGIQEITHVPEKTPELKTMMQTEPKISQKFSSVSNVLTTSPDATLNSQQDTSDYVSATGDDLSITDWEYQLPAPPSAFRDNVSPDFDGYDTITLRSIEAFKETPVNTPEPEKTPIPEPSSRQSPILSPKETIPLRTRAVIDKTESQCSPDTRSSLHTEKPKPSPDVFLECRSVDVATGLKKDIISELSTKIESGSLPRMNGRHTEQDARRTTLARSPPKIAPIDNTLSNFTITTYSRKKSLNIFEDETTEEKQSFGNVVNSTNKVHGSETSMSSDSIENARRDSDSRTMLNRVEKNIPQELNSSVQTPDSEDRVMKSQSDMKKTQAKISHTQHDSLLRHSSFSKGQETKSTNVYRSKSYVTLANNSKYREDTNGDRRNESRKLENDDSRMIKSTSVTNLNQDSFKNNEKFSQWRENILKKQEEQSKEKQLQSLQVLKNILPRLKSNQQTEENVPDSPSERENSIHTGCKSFLETESIEPKKSSVLVTRAETDVAKPQKPTAEDATTKRYKYTGPPAISLGSWSERPRVNVQLKMDTDYKFATSNNTSGSKTRVNINGTSTEKNDQKDIERDTTLPKSFSDNVGKGRKTSHEETIQVRRESEDALSKKLITHTTATGFKKPASNRIIFSEIRKVAQNSDEIKEKPIVTSVALKKAPVENTNARTDHKEPEDDVKIDTKPVDFRELSKTFGQEVCLRTKPKRVLQNRHSDYYGNRPEIVQNLQNAVNGQASVWEAANKNALKHADTLKNHVSNGVPSANQGTTRRYTSIVGIQSHNNNNYRAENVESIAKGYTTTTKVNGLMPVVKGFKISSNHSEASNMTVSRARENGISNVNTVSRTSNVSPPTPPTMPIITGVTLKNSTARPKSMPICNIDSRDQLLESIRNFGGRGGLKSMRS